MKITVGCHFNFFFYEKDNFCTIRTEQIFINCELRCALCDFFLFYFNQACVPVVTLFYLELSTKKAALKKPAVWKVKNIFQDGNSPKNVKKKL